MPCRQGQTRTLTHVAAANIAAKLARGGITIGATEGPVATEAVNKFTQKVVFLVK
jgi:hypothetical protein